MSTHLFRELFRIIETTPIIETRPVLDKDMRQVYNKMASKMNISPKDKIVIQSFACWLMNRMMNVLMLKKGGMRPGPLTMVATNKKNPYKKKRVLNELNQIDVNADENGLNPLEYAEQMRLNEELRRSRTPSKSYIFSLILLIAFGTFLIIESYKRGLSIAMELNYYATESIENNAYAEIAFDVINNPKYDTNSSDGSYTYHVWNALAKTVGLNRLPTQNDVNIISLRLMQEITIDAAKGLNKAAVQCGYVMIPHRSEFIDGIRGTFQYNAAKSIAYATNAAAGGSPGECALSVTATKIAHSGTTLIADFSIKSTQLLSKVSVIKNFMTFAFTILTYAIPNTYKLIKNAVFYDDPVLAQIREDTTKSARNVSLRELELREVIHANGISSSDDDDDEDEDDDESPVFHDMMQIEDIKNEGDGIARFRKTKRNRRKTQVNQKKRKSTHKRIPKSRRY